MRKTPEERFRRFVPEIANDNGCMEWSGGKTTDGYGVFSSRTADGDARSASAHRFAWELHYGRRLQAGEVVCHTCDNPSCVNPAHLVAATVLANIADRCAKGRSARGSRSGRSLLTEPDVLSIRGCLADGMSRRDVAQHFGCSPQTVDSIRAGRSWVWLQDAKATA